MANDSLKDFLAAGDSGDEREFTSGEDFYQLYLEELKLVPPCSPEEEERLLDEVEALKAITLNPAQVIGIDGRKGQLKEGLDADIVIWNKHPFAHDVAVERVLLNGAWVEN